MRPIPYTVQAEQDDHAVRTHGPDVVCQRCPIEQWRRVDMVRRMIEIDRRETIRRRVAVTLLLIVLLGCWVLAGLIH